MVDGVTDAGTQTRPTIGMGILSWKGFKSLRHSLETYTRENLFSLFDEALVFLPEIDDEGVAIAKEHNIAYEGSEKNLGVMGGFKAVASALKSDIVLIIENDCPLLESHEECRRQIAIAHRAVADEEVAVFRMRHTQHPGEKFPTLEKYLRYHGPGFGPTLRRTLRPGKARRLAGTSVYAEPNPEEHFPDLIERRPEGWFSVSAECLPWTSQSIIVRRDFYLGTIIPFAEQNPRSRAHPAIEVEWNRPVWRNSGWRIGMDKGLFTHQRLD